MANSIALFKKYVDKLDEVYQYAATTAVLESDATLASQGANANEIVIPKIAMDGLGNYSRNSGYVGGDVTMTNETVQFNYDRGRKFSVDAMDNEETAGLAFGKLASEFVRTKVAPEIDAFRFAKYAGEAGKKVVATLSSGSDVLTALQAAQSYLDDKEVSTESRYLFITSGLLREAQNVTTTTSKAVLDEFAKIITVPSARFLTSITFNDGTTSGQTAGGYKKTSAVYEASTDTSVVSGKTYYTKSGDVYSKVENPTGNPSTSGYYEKTVEESHYINFLIVEKSALMQYTKHSVNKAISPDDNPDADAWQFNFRSYGLADVYENKIDGLYVHHLAADANA